LLADYPYFASELISLLTLCLALVFAPKQCGTALFGGAILALYSPLSLLHDAVYWMPRRLFGGGWGIEDVLFCFNCGAMVWLAAIWPWRDRMQTSLDARLLIRRSLICLAVFASTLAALLLSSAAVMPSFIVAQTVLAAFVLSLRPASWRLAISAVMLFPLYYFLHLSLDTVLFPDFLDMWRGSQIIHVGVYGVPIEEFLWVLSFSASFPIALAYGVNASIATERAPLDKRKSIAAHS
jgi:hypothetical protein